MISRATGGRFGAAALGQLEEIVSHYPSAAGAILPALWMAQRRGGNQVGLAAISLGG